MCRGQNVRRSLARAPLERPLLPPAGLALHLGSAGLLDRPGLGRWRSVL